MFFPIFAIRSVVFLFAFTLVVANKNIAWSMWDGVSAYLAVDAVKVQERLNKYANSTPGAPQLYVPTNPVFSNIQPGQHVVYVDFGTISSLNFDDTEGLPTSGAETSVFIPFLSDSEDGPPHYNLALYELYPRDRGDIPPMLPLLPYTPVDELTVTCSSATLRNGENELVVNFNVSNPCIKADSLVVQELHTMSLKDLTFVSPDPDLDFCDRHPDIPDSNKYCSKMKEIKQDVAMNLPNVCSFFSFKGEHSCKTSFTITSITSGARELLLLGDGPVEIVSAGKFSGVLASGLQYPCI